MESILTEKYWAVVKEGDQDDLSHRIFDSNGRLFASLEEAKAFLNYGRQNDFNIAIGVYAFECEAAYPFESDEEFIAEEIKDYVQSQKKLPFQLDAISKRFLLRLHNQHGIYSDYHLGKGRIIEPVSEIAIKILEEKGLIKQLAPFSNKRKFQINISPAKLRELK